MENKEQEDRRVAPTWQDTYITQLQEEIDNLRDLYDEALRQRDYLMRCIDEARCDLNSALEQIEIDA